MSEALFFRRSTCIGFYTDQEPPLEIAEGVEIQEQMMDLIWCYDVARLYLTMVILSRGNDTSRKLSVFDSLSRLGLNAPGEPRDPVRICVPSQGSRGRPSNDHLSVSAALDCREIPLPVRARHLDLPTSRAIW